MARKKTNEEFIKEVYDLVGDEYAFLDEYNGNKTKIKCRHNKCGYEWVVIPANFLNRGSRCPKCFGNIKKSNKEFKREIYDLVGYEYQFLDNYINNSTKLPCKHNKCGHEWMITPLKFLQGRRCPQCAGNKQKTNEEFVEEAYSLVGDEYEFLEEYTNALAKIKCKHNKCNYEWSVTPSAFLNNRTRCPKCFGTRLKTQEQFEEDVYALVSNEYKVLGEYNGTTEYIEIKHSKCGYTYSVRASHFLYSASRCPLCSKSKGEEKVRLYLKKQNIKLIPQHSFDDCRNKNPLPFDFYLPDHSVIIEYDGIQHYKPVDFAGKGDEWAIENFNYQQQNNNIKNQYCLNNNITLMRIPYWDFDNIDQILEEWLHNYDLLPKEQGIV